MGKTPNAEGQHFILFGPFQQIKANRKQTQVKLTASKQCIRRSAFGVRRSAFGVRRSAFGVRRSAFYPCRAESTGVDWDSFCREVCEITLLESSERLGGEEKIVRLMKASLGEGSIIEDIMWKDNGYSAA